MAELTHLDEKLAEVLGLAQAAQTATKRVSTLARKEKDTELLELLQRMGDEAAQVEQRIVAFAVPLQQTHVQAVKEHSLRLAAREDPTEPA